MTNGGQSLHLSGCKMANGSTLDVNATSAVQNLKQELIRCQAENAKLSDQLNCLVTLIKRSWAGDQNATIHLSNIVGLEPPKSFGSQTDGSVARPNSEAQVKTRSEYNWERLTLKLLDREYQCVQREIQEYQQRYIENRQAYMDAVLQDHQQSMSALSLSRNSDATDAVRELDKKFIQHDKALRRMGVAKNASHRKGSAGGKRSSSNQETPDLTGLTMLELVGETPSSKHFGSVPANGHLTKQLSEGALRNTTPSRGYRYPPNAYNDPNRYTETSLYALREQDGMRKPRPVSASSLKDGDNIRARPKTAAYARDKQTFITQNNERSLKYETTRPVLHQRSKSAKHRRGSAEGQLKPSLSQSSLASRSNNHAMSNTNLSAPSSFINIETVSDNRIQQDSNTNSANELPQDTDGNDSEYQYESEYFDSKPPIAIRVKSAFQRRPAAIDKFADDEKVMKEMEADFRKTALSLQKKLGIEDQGMIDID